MLKRLLSQSYLIAMVIAVLIGLFVPQAHALGKWNTLLLQIIFFLSCLKLDLKAMRGYAQDWKFLTLATFLMLIGFPFLIWAVGRIWPSDLMFAIYLLAAMPIGMTAALLVELAGGRPGITMMLTVTTSLFAPLTIPLLTKLLYGASIAVSALDLFKQLALVIFVPFILSVIIRLILPRATHQIKDKTKPLSIILLALLIAGAIAKQAGPATTLADNWLYLAMVIIVLYIFFFATNALGYFSFWWEPHETKQTASVSLACMNFTLAIYLAGQFFPRPTIVLPLVFAIVPWVTFMPVWMRVSSKFK